MIIIVKVLRYKVKSLITEIKIKCNNKTMMVMKVVRISLDTRNPLTLNENDIPFPDKIL